MTEMKRPTVCGLKILLDSSRDYFLCVHPCSLAYNIFMRGVRICQNYITCSAWGSAVCFKYIIYRYTYILHNNSFISDLSALLPVRWECMGSDALCSFITTCSSDGMKSGNKFLRLYFWLYHKSTAHSVFPARAAIIYRVPLLVIHIQVEKSRSLLQSLSTYV